MRLGAQAGLAAGDHLSPFLHSNTDIKFLLDEHGGDGLRCVMRTYLKAALVTAILLLISCSSEPVKKADGSSGKTAVPVPQGPISGKTAFWEMYRSAHSWAADVQPLSLESKEVPGMKNAGGKAAMWSATFGSPSRHQFRTYSYSIAEHKPEIVQGLMIGNAQAWGGPRNEALTFDTSELVVDSDAAYQTAAAQAAAWMRKNPGKEASFALGNASRFTGPVWYVLWGDKKSGYSVYVNAKSGTIAKPK